MLIKKVLYLFSHIYVDLIYPNLLGFLSERQLRILSVLNLFLLKIKSKLNFLSLYSFTLFDVLKIRVNALDLVVFVIHSDKSD